MLNALQSKGFSLLEILVAFSIALIFLTITLPSQEIFLRQSKSDIMRLQLLRAIHIARQEAILRSEKITLCPSLNQTTCSGQWKEGYIVLSHQTVIYSFLSGKNAGQLHWRAFPRNQTQLDYLPSGELAAENGTFWYCLPAAKEPSWAIVVSQTGRAREVLMPQGREGIESKIKCD